LPLAEEALALRGKLLGEKHRDYALSLFTLGAQHQALRQVRQAELCYLRARDILKEGLGEKHPDYATTLHHLAVLYRTMGDYARAEPLYRQARDTRKEALGEKHPATSTRPRWARSTASTPPACTTWPFSSSPESRP
jgi:tetratricopeptide (TPR) repeat protein